MVGRAEFTSSSAEVSTHPAAGATPTQHDTSTVQQRRLVAAGALRGADGGLVAGRLVATGIDGRGEHAARASVELAPIRWENRLLLVVCKLVSHGENQNLGAADGGYLRVI